MREVKSVLQRIKEQNKNEAKRTWYGIKTIPMAQKRAIFFAIAAYIVVFTVVGIMYGVAYVVAGIFILLGMLLGGFLWLIVIPKFYRLIKSKFVKASKP